MKKIGVLFIFLLLGLSLFSFVSAEDETPPSAGVGDEDVEKIQGAVDDYVPIDDSGEFNSSKFTPQISKAEERIKEINQWLSDNASWLAVVFGMVPEISWLFAINSWSLLFFFTLLVLNGNIFGIGLEILNKKIDLGFFETSWANILGLAIFILLDITKYIFIFSNYLHNLFLFLYIYGWIAVVGAGIVLVVLMIFFPRVLMKIVVSAKLKRREKARAQASFDRKVLHTTVKSMQESSR